jgi:hypothetical protein
MHENFSTCNRYIPSSTKNINLEFYQDVRLKNGVSMERLIPRSQARRLGVKQVRAARDITQITQIEASTALLQTVSFFFFFF